MLGLGKNTARHHLLNRLQLAGGTNAGVGGEGDERVAPRRLRSTSMPPLVPASAGRTTGWRWVRRWYFAGNFTENRWELLYNEVGAEPLAASPRSVAPCIPFPFFFSPDQDLGFRLNEIMGCFLVLLIWTDKDSLY